MNKFTCFSLFFCFSIQVFADSSFSIIILDFKNTPLREILNSIKKQSEYSFVYERGQLEKINPISVKVSSSDIEVVLDAVFKGLNIDYTIEEDQKIIIIHSRKKKAISANPEVNQAIHGNRIDIMGVVLNDKNEPIPGASIKVKGSELGTSTKIDGSFTLNGVDENSLVIVSSVGFETQTIQIGKLRTLRITLYVSAQEMKEVIVNTGYQNVPKERATGSFDYIDNKLLNQQVGSNIMDRLRSVSNGILFDDSKIKSEQKKYNFNVRGLATVNGPQDPLIVIDNFPYEGDINNINPNDIESVSILKDAAAASIWGPRAGNGVIVITTKKGRFNQPLKIDFTSTVIITEKPDLFALPQMSSSDYIEVEQMLYREGAYNSLINNLGRTAISPALEVFERRRQGLISERDSALQINTLKKQDVRNDYDKYFYSKATLQQYSINLRGGSGNIAYLISGGYDKNIDNLQANGERYTIHLENIYAPLKNLQISSGIIYANAKQGNGRPTYNSISIGGRQIPYLRFSDDNGNALPVAINYREAYTDTAGSGKLLNWKYIPLENYKHKTSDRSSQDINANLGLLYRFSSDFSIDIKFQYQKLQQVTENLQSSESFEARNLINLFSQIDNNGQVKRIVPLGGIFTRFDATTQSRNLRGQLNYNKYWNWHGISIIGGAEIRQTKAQSNAYTIYGYNDELLVTGNVDFLNQYPTFVTGELAAIGNGLSLSETVDRFVSLFGNAAYTVKEKYVLTGSFRKDASNLFGLKTNDKWRPFWSTGFSWEISKENFFKTNLFSYLRFRATYGYSGNVDQTKSGVTIIEYAGGGANNTNYPFARVSQFYNPELRWEKVGTFNIGLDFSIKNQTLSGSIEYYVKKGTDLFGPAPIDYTSGLGTNVIVRNIADTKGKGVDIKIESKNFTRELKWNTTLIFNYNLSRVTQYYGSEKGALTPGNSIVPILGKPLYSIISYKWGGLDKDGNPQGFVGGKLSTDYAAIVNTLTNVDSFKYSGPASPRYFGSIINSFSYKGVNLSFNISYNLGYYFRRPSISYSNLTNNGIGHSDYSSRWQKTGDEQVTSIPSFIYPSDERRDLFYLFSEATVEKGDHIRLQYINLGYDLSNLWQKKSKLQFQIFINASNLGILWRANKLGLDPEFPGTVPTSKSYAFGIRGSF